MQNEGIQLCFGGILGRQAAAFQRFFTRTTTFFTTCKVQTTTAALHFAFVPFLIECFLLASNSFFDNDDRQSESFNFYFEGIVIAARKASERVALALILH